jgi:hypothetical protein
MRDPKPLPVYVRVFFGIAGLAMLARGLMQLGLLG